MKWMVLVLCLVALNSATKAKPAFQRTVEALTDYIQKTLATGPVQVLGWEDCGGEAMAAVQVTVDPDPPVKGQLVTFKVLGQPTDDFTYNKVEIDVYISGWKIWT
eukprot:CAMPEP_0201281262 /NCGR_PEP_ID=MMETSP1317-20130820/2085_1 /ASSEMBLY_ACC=CAM_ASM_000770 /TAXON_ID=187299 /ORGANISM="Undescribed Undescribed, Strain Undescribed" /LENGTH=104 /DNA_ID=CAMNT_0047590637 /DNA_START=45 /DNA_END=359 /DNA_ORIENTATION=+